MADFLTDICNECGRDIEDADEQRAANSTFCTECDRHIVPAPGSPLRTWYDDDLPNMAAEMKADWLRSKFHLVTEGARS